MTTERILSFEKAYLEVRQKEGRLYQDAEVKQLPFISKNHRHYREWQIRSQSFKNLIKWLNQQTHYQNILEIGCGNGWLCNRLHQAGYNVHGTDINTVELSQAKRLFSEIEFSYLDIFNSRSEKKYDVVLFASSLQYFHNPTEAILLSMKKFLKLAGCVIIADTKFYHRHKVEEAKERSNQYFSKLQSSMSNFYFHHSYELLKEFQVQQIRSHYTLWHKITGRYKPFDLYILKPLKPQDIE